MLELGLVEVITPKQKRIKSFVCLFVNLFFFSFSFANSAHKNGPSFWNCLGLTYLSDFSVEYLTIL